MKEKRLSWQNEKDVEIAAKALQEGEIVVGDTDTVPGIFAACTALGVAKLNAIKERSDKPYLILLGSRDSLLLFIKQPSSIQIEKLIEKFWPGPLTLIFQAQEDIPTYLQSRQGGIAIRVPEHPGVKELALRCGGVLSTSANLGGKPTPETLQEVDLQIVQMASFVLCDERGISSDKPSTILDVTGKQIRVIREGAIPVEELEALVGAAFIR